MFDPSIIVVSRNEVETRNLSGPLAVLKSCIASVDHIRSHFNRLDITFHGYDDDRRELWQIPTVREYVWSLDDKSPYWLYFLTKEGLGLQCLMYCLMPPYLSESGRRTVLPQRLHQLLTERWFPAMDQMCDAAGFSEDEIDALTHLFIFHGPSLRERLHHK
jgi:hypothetical protein